MYRGPYEIPIGKAKVVSEGKDITIVTHSCSSILSLRAMKILEKYNVDIELIDLRSIMPLDKDTILKSVKKTKRLLVVDNGWTSFGVSSEIISMVAENLGSLLISNPIRIGVENVPIPSTRELAKLAYPNTTKIVNLVLKFLT